MIKLVIDKDGVAREYDDTYDITIHCETEEEQLQAREYLRNLSNPYDGEDECISRKEAIEAVEFGITYAKAINLETGETKPLFERENEALRKAASRIQALQTREPKRIKGHWNITGAYPHNVHCSVCYKRFAQTHWEVWKDGSLPRNFCPNCGADMREEQNGKSERQI